MKNLLVASLVCGTLVSVSSAFAKLPDNAADRIAGICSARHGDVVMDGLAAFARKYELTRDEMSAAMVEVIDRRDKSRRDPVRAMATSWLDVFGGTNALPTLRRMALDPDDQNGGNAIWSYYGLAGYSDESLSWAQAFLLEEQTEASERRREFLNVFRHALAGGDMPAHEREALGRVLLRVTETDDYAPDWTDEVLCRNFPDYAGSVERRARLEAALARIPPSPPQRTDSMPDWTNQLRTSLSNALATAVATNPAPFSIPAVRAAPRVLPDEFVLPEIPQEWRQ